MSGPDRLEKLLNTTQKNIVGLDFVYVDRNDPYNLHVYFLSPLNVSAKDLLTGSPPLQASQVHIYCPSAGKDAPEVEVTSIVWAQGVNGRDVLRIKVAEPGGFALYRLWMDDSRIDTYRVDAEPTAERQIRGHNHIPFSFKAYCTSDLDCKPREHECPPATEVDFPVDYRARDFWSFRRALLDFASLRYPDWKDRLEADAGVMLAEVMSALGDELAYYQDRVAREAYLETASQRRSLRRHARLVDYTVHDGLGATTWLDVTVKDGQSNTIPAGADVWAVTEYGDLILFEVGRGLEEVVNKVTYAVDSVRNPLKLKPHLWDKDNVCLPVGATDLYLEGHHTAGLSLDDNPKDKVPGRWVLLKTNPSKSNRALARRWLVRLIEVVDDDKGGQPLKDPLTSDEITHLVWEEDQALPFELDMTALEVRANLVPATAGETYGLETQKKIHFTIGHLENAWDWPEAVEREGSDSGPARLLSQEIYPGKEAPSPPEEASRSIAYLFSLPGSESRGLVWVGEDARHATPEIRLVEMERQGNDWKEGKEWKWRRTLMGTDSSQPYDRHFTLDDGFWKRVVGYQRTGKEVVHVDYGADTGTTIRFGDGEFGMIPTKGTVFKVTYRLDGGRRGNLPADSITCFEPQYEKFIKEVTNPLPVTNGLDPETPEEVRKYAPDAFRQDTFRAVRSEDYAEAAKRLPWVQNAGASFRWTGSWLSAFVTPDPREAVVVTAPQRCELQDQLDRFRQAGREVHTLDPQYADLDLRIWICIQPTAYQGETKEAVLQALLGNKGVRARAGFFSPDNFTFGTPLHRSALEATIQAVPGVRAVEKMEIRHRGWFDWRPFDELEHEVSMDQVIRLENDVLHPERGSLTLYMEGGA